MNSHVASRASNVRSGMPIRLPYVPRTIPATTVAMIPEAWTWSASRYVP